MGPTGEDLIVVVLCWGVKKLVDAEELPLKKYLQGHSGAKVSEYHGCGDWRGIRRRISTAGQSGHCMDGIAAVREEYESLSANIPNLSNNVLLPGVGHWTQQERPREVNRLLIEFLRAL